MGPTDTDELSLLVMLVLLCVVGIVTAAMVGNTVVEAATVSMFGR